MTLWHYNAYGILANSVSLCLFFCSIILTQVYDWFDEKVFLYVRGNIKNGILNYEIDNNFIKGLYAILYNAFIFSKNILVSTIVQYDDIQIFPYDYLKYTGEVNYVNSFLKKICCNLKFDEEN